MRIVDLFSGCGGMSLGFQNAGFKIASAFDNWIKAIEVYKQNFDHPIFERDLRNSSAIDEIASFTPDIIIGGPPCQDFSSAGLRSESLGRADLTVRYAQIVAAIRPAYFVMENVERVEKSAAYKNTLLIFRNADYGLTSIVLDASLCGVPQKRKRFFLIGELGGSDSALMPYLTENMSTKPTTIRDYFGDVLGIEHFYRHPRSYARRGVFSIDEPSPTIRGVNRPIPLGYPGHPGDSTNDLSTVRPLTTLERSYIQTFPKWFKFTGTKTDLEQMIGNAVPVKLSEFVGKALYKYTVDKSAGTVQEVHQSENKKRFEQLKLFGFSMGLLAIPNPSRGSGC